VKLLNQTSISIIVWVCFHTIEMDILLLLQTAAGTLPLLPFPIRAIISRYSNIAFSPKVRTEGRKEPRSEDVSVGALVADSVSDLLSRALLVLIDSQNERVSSCYSW
jgi:hypothetical protein